MSIDTAVREYHAEQTVVARQFYLRSRTPPADMADWDASLSGAQKRIDDALRASQFLHAVEEALEENGRHMVVFRHLLAPPMSQDQFKLFCPEWSKHSEVRGRPVKPAVARIVAAAFHARRHNTLSPWLDAERTPTTSEVAQLLAAVAPLMASQTFMTTQRNRLAAQQESLVTEMLNWMGWTKLPSKMLDTKAALPARHYMHKTRFATASEAPQEVDIACGLGRTVVLAMECKVTNDATNSIKRINDILKKASAWSKHWGSFVRTAALLQGVIHTKDVNRLLDENVEVFWAHELAVFGEWLIDSVGEA